MMSLHFTAYGLTDIGCVRDRNEDAFLILDYPALLAVADGIGGHDAGDFASRTLVTMLEQMRMAGNIDALAEDAEAQIRLANTVLLEESRGRGGDVIGSTVVCLVTYGDEACVLWSGDSRAYCLRNGSLRPLTEDHNVAQEMVAMGRLTREKARNHPLSTRITQAVGLDDGMVPERRFLTLEEGDRLLLCTDGLTTCLTDEDIARCLSTENDDEGVCEAMLDICIDRDAPDNVTIICATVQA